MTMGLHFTKEFIILMVYWLTIFMVLKSMDFGIKETYFQIEALSYACCVTLKSISPMSLLPYLVSGHNI